MKSLFILPIAAYLFFTSQAIAFTGEDFQKLTPEQQREFIVELRKITADMDLKSDYFAETKEPTSQRSVASEPWRRADGTDSRDPVKREYTYVGSNKDNVAAAKAAYARFKQNVRGKSGTLASADFKDAQLALSMLVGEMTNIKESGNYAKLEARRKELVATFAEISGNLRSNYRLPGDVDDYLSKQERIFRSQKMGLNAEEHRRFSDSGLLPSTKSSPSQKVKKETSQASSTPLVRGGADSAKSVRGSATSTAPAAKTTSSTSPRSSEQSSAWLPNPNENPKDKILAKESKGKNKAADKDDYEFSSCMFGGFILKTALCTPPRELPATFSLMDQHERMKFKCENKQQMICNPLLFGFEGDCDLSQDVRLCFTKAKPVCINPVADATSTCREKTKSDKYLDRAVAIIKSKPKLLDQYFKDFNELCEPAQSAKNRFIHKTVSGAKRTNAEATKVDIEKTCEAAKPRLTYLVDRYAALSKKRAGEKPASAETFRGDK